MRNIFFFFLLIGWLKEGSGDEGWGYEEGDHDPDHWCHFVESCCGERQSPINFEKPTRVTTSRQHRFEFHDYDVTPSTMKMVNNGHTVITFITSDDVRPSISGGGLEGEYLFSGLHFHWGNDSLRGSEHTLSGFNYAMEMHLVHYKSTYESVKEAVMSNDPLALAVLGIWFVVITDVDNPSFVPVTEMLQAVQYNGQSTNLRRTFPLEQIMPASTDVYFRYMGSLTTPTCNEDVTWTVFPSVLRISEVQLEKFRNLFFTHDDEDPEHLVNNFRSVQPHNGRQISYVNAS